MRWIPWSGSPRVRTGVRAPQEVGAELRDDRLTGRLRLGLRLGDDGRDSGWLTQSEALRSLFSAVTAAMVHSSSAFFFREKEIFPRRAP